jgi:hypothetical protein
LIEDEEPIGFRHYWIDVTRDDSGRDIVHNHETIKRFRVIFGEARRDTRSPVMPN